jgi:outer membrane phospholipase A
MVFKKIVTFFPVHIVLLLLLSISSSASAASGITTMLRFSELNIRAGETVQIKAYFYNEGGDVCEFDLPDSLAIRIKSSDGASLLVTAIETDNSIKAILQPKEFVTKEYNLVLPEHYNGPQEISLADSPETALLVNIIDEKYVKKDDNTASSQKILNDYYPSMDSLFSLYQPYVVNFSVYEPIYFLLGTDPSESKFQISMKYRPFNPAGSLSRKYPWLSGLNFAYTQTSFWNLASDSAPFEDTSYKPEALYLTRNWPNRPSWLKGLFFQGGIQHESNGRDGVSSRSTNTVYFKPIFIFYDEDNGLGLQFSPKLFTYFNNSEKNNRDLPDYRGNVEFEIKLGEARGLVSSTYLRFADKGRSVQTNLSYPVSRLLKNNFDLFFHVQYSYSLAESLINYKDRTQALRIGFSIVR